jgi:hypothetical protein
LKTLLAAVVLAGLSSLSAGCSSGRTGDREAAAASPGAAADYTLFALRCSKCHSLSRPLNSGIDSDEYWRLYVAKMRRQPGSGISAEDSVGILRFLHLYSIEQRRKKEEKLGIEPAQGSPSQPDASSPDGAP